MSRIVFLMPEIIAGVTLLIPLLLVYQRFFFHSWKRTLAYLVFGAYLIAVLCLVGFPSIRDIRFDANINLIPIVGMADSIRDTLLNVLLFIPLGCFLPLLWVRYRSLLPALGFGFLVSLTIEVSQLFTYRATDVDDLITNVLGTLCGFLLANGFTKGYTTHIGSGNSEKELALLCGSVVFVMFFLQPFLSPLLY